MWEHENMEDSSRKTALFLSQRVSLNILRMGFKVECDTSEQRLLLTLCGFVVFLCLAVERGLSLYAWSSLQSKERENNSKNNIRLSCTAVCVGCSITVTNGNSLLVITFIHYG